MSSPNRKPRQKKNNERIIPIVIDGDELKDGVNDTEEDKSTAVTDSKNLGNISTSTDVSEDTSICSSVSTLVLSDVGEINASTEQDAEIKIPEPILPPYNVPEKIIIILDRAEDEISTFFELGNGNKVKPLDMLKDSLKFFINCKNAIDVKHEFALITLNENSATWVHDFTNNVKSIIKELDDIGECETEDIFDITSVFDLINKKVEIPTLKADLIIPPPFVVRAAFLYNRSITMPQIELTQEINSILTSPYFTFDIVMTHEIPDSSNKCNLIFKKLQQLDTKGLAYFFPVSRSATLLHTAIAKLLSHPLQRCAQKDANYKLKCN